MTADAVRWCIYATPFPPPQLRVRMSKTLTTTSFYENFVPLLLHERPADVLYPPRPSIPSFPAVERVTEPVPRVKVIRSYSTIPCDVLSSSHHHRMKLRYQFMAFFITLIYLVRKPVPARGYDQASEKKPQGGLCSYLSLHFGNIFSSST